MPRRRRSIADPKLAIGYIRCSTTEQRLGPEAQRECLTRWCAANDVKLVGVHEDLGISGGAELEKRPQLIAAIDAIGTTGAGHLLVAKRDRLARDVVLAAMIERLVERHAARVVTADGTGNGTTPEAALMRTIVDGFAQYERAVIRARTKAALQVKRARGERAGGVPFGYAVSADGIALEPDDDEQRALATIAELRTSGRSIRAIAEELNRRDIPARGARWHRTSIERILRRRADG